ncbi:MAG: homoserine O-succinyltransferase [Pseudomonadota bacterium]
MPIVLPNELPARDILVGEGVAVTAHEAPLKVALVNLMPQKPATERQFARLLAHSPFAVDLTLLLPSGYEPKTTGHDHLKRFYQRWEDVAHHRFDGLIVTGAPVELLPFGAVTYWRSLARLFDWADDHVGLSLYVCWAAQAALFHRHGIRKEPLPRKVFGLYQQDIEDSGHWLVRGLGGRMTTPVSRHTTVDQRAIDDVDDLVTLAASNETGPCLLADEQRSAAYMFNHLEYEADTLWNEYHRDATAGLDTREPLNMKARKRDALGRPPWWRDSRVFFDNWVGAMARRRCATIVPPALSRQAFVPRHHLPC